jgi:hypothetical protein
MSAFPHSVVAWLSYLFDAAILSYAIWAYIEALRHRPKFGAADIVIQEWFASGASQRNILTSIGGARNCIRLVVTKELLWVTTWFPFSIIGPFFDLEHVVPLGSITSVRKGRFLFTTLLLVTFSKSNGRSLTLRLLPKKMDEFVTSIGGFKNEQRA